MNFHNDDSSVKPRKDLLAASRSGQQTSDFIEGQQGWANGIEDIQLRGSSINSVAFALPATSNLEAWDALGSYGRNR
jgi:hypothetical protein